MIAFVPWGVVSTLSTLLRVAFCVTLFFTKGNYKMTDKRLLKCAEYVCGGGIAADIGTDHAYLPVHLLKNGISPRAFACDIKDGPLEAAKTTISSNGLEDKITALKSDGLDSVPLEGVTDVIIAGMGGEMIADIISRCDHLKTNNTNLVLQPMTKAHHLRRFLCENGFYIKNESAVSSGVFCYTVINSEYQGGKIDHDDYFLYTGKLSNKTDDDVRYLREISKKLKTAALGMKSSKDKLSESERLSEISNRIDEFLKETEK